MPVTFSCDACRTRIQVKDELSGRRVKCPKCTTVIVVPQTAPRAATVEPAALTAASLVSRKRTGSDVGERPASQCPSCQADLTPDARLCVQCGYDLTTGTKLATEHAPTSTERSFDVVGTLTTSVMYAILAGLAIAAAAFQWLAFEEEFIVTRLFYQFVAIVFAVFAAWVAETAWPALVVLLIALFVCFDWMSKEDEPWPNQVYKASLVVIVLGLVYTVTRLDFGVWLALFLPDPEERLKRRQEKRRRRKRSDARKKRRRWRSDAVPPIRRCSTTWASSSTRTSRTARPPKSSSAPARWRPTRPRRNTCWERVTLPLRTSMKATTRRSTNGCNERRGPSRGRPERQRSPAS